MTVTIPGTETGAQRGAAGAQGGAAGAQGGAAGAQGGAIRKGVRRGADTARRQELGAFLRSRRDRLAPEAVGLPSVGRRRAPGLRREEVAQLAGVGVTWYTWLEQGRPINVSAQVIGAVARALRLDDDEIAHLFTLAGLPAPTVVSEEEVIAASLSAILDGLDPLPAYAVSARYDLLAWNRSCATLMGDFARLPPHRRNMLWLLFAERSLRERVGGYDTETGTQCVARFRRNFAAHIGDPAWRALVDELYERSEEFRRLWDRHDVASNSSKIKDFRHPLVGRLRLASTTLWLADQPGARLVVYNPVDSRGRDLLERLTRLTGEPPPPSTRTSAPPG
ncbi:helix-turn-helix transcriptional regulator [Microbispora sp. CA-135349]|uniref:helix-turn-helix transcriptional regulator n=1 Tax=Microbispora sp. CA-135349 TaxID=3239953 RepID=UPI003D8CC5AD